MVLKELRNIYPYINMVHLDSFLWQKGKTELMVNFESKQKLKNNSSNKENKEMVEKKYGKNKDIYRVVEKGDCIELYVCHDNKQVKKTLQKYKNDPRYLLNYYDTYSHSFISAEKWLAKVIDDYRSYFEQNKVQIIFDGKKQPSTKEVELIREKLVKLGFDEKEAGEKAKLLNIKGLLAPEELPDDKFLSLRQIIEKIVCNKIGEDMYEKVGKKLFEAINLATKEGLLPSDLKSYFDFVRITTNAYMHVDKPPLSKRPTDFSSCRKMVKYILGKLEI